MSLLFSVLKKTIWITLILGTAGVAYLSYTILSSSMPLYKLLENAEDNSVGKKYIYYLVDSKDEYNKVWWTWSFNQRLNKDKEDLSPEFKDLKNEEELRNKCQESYSKTYVSLERNSQYAQNIWKYCSVLKYKPKTIEESKEIKEQEYWESNDSDKLGSKLKDRLVSTASTEKNNLEFWHFKDLEFFGKENEPGSGHHTKKNDQIKSIFEEWYDHKGNINKPYVVKGLCDEAYKKTDTPNTKDSLVAPKEQVLKHCSI